MRQLLTIKVIDLKKIVRVNADYYINTVQKAFLAKGVPRLLLGRESDMVFHQDSASTQTAKKTTDFLNKCKVKYITPVEWVP